MKLQRCLVLALAVQLSGCASAPERERHIPIRVHAAPKLNSGLAGSPLALVLRIYKLRERSTFDRLAVATFLDSEKERAALGNDLIEVKEVTLIPNQKYEVIDKFSRDAGFVGVVAFFYAPAPQRWRAAIPVSKIEKNGLVIGVHACSLVLGMDPAMRAPAPCQ